MEYTSRPRMKQAFYLYLMTVSFWGLSILEEVCTNEIAPTGYFLIPQEGIHLSHTKKAGAGRPFKVEKGNFIGIDQAGCEDVLSRINDSGNLTEDKIFGWREGELIWEIPIAWAARDATEDISEDEYYRLSDEMRQTFRITENGTFSVRKDLAQGTRTTNNVYYCGSTIIVDKQNENTN